MAFFSNMQVAASRNASGILLRLTAGYSSCDLMADAASTSFSDALKRMLLPYHRSSYSVFSAYRQE
jgi:hypothetical protein